MSHHVDAPLVIQQKRCRRWYLDVFAEECVDVWVHRPREEFRWLHESSDRVLSIGHEPSWFLEEDGELLSQLEEHLGRNDVSIALLTGASRGQPMRVRLYAPEYWETPNTPDGPAEWDVTYEWELLEVDPWSDTRSLEGICTLIRDQRLAQLHMEVRHAQRRLDDEQETTGFYIAVSPYFTSGQSTWDDMEMPQGIALCLRRRQSDGFGLREIAHGRSDSGCKKEAMRRLRADIDIRRPGLVGLDLGQLQWRSW